MSLFRRIRALNFRSEIDRDVADELNSHIMMRTADNVAAGMSPDAARRNALLRFGNPTVVKERVIAEDAALGLDTSFRNLKYAIRQIEKSRVFAITVIVTLALGIGATTAIFSVMYAVLLRPLPYVNADRLVYVLGEMHRRNTADLPFSNADYIDLRNGAKSLFQEFSSVRTGFMLVQQKDGTAAQVRSATVTPNFFHLMGGKISVGRNFQDTDGQTQQASDTTEANSPAQAPPAVAILNYEYWKRRYGGSTAVLGQRLSYGADAGPEIVGVLSPGFELLFPASLGVEHLPEVWVAERLNYDNAQRNSMSLRVVGRLKDASSLENAQSEVERIAAGFRRDFPLKQTSDFHIKLQPMRQYLVATVKPSILALMGAAAFLLLIACANVANLLLVRMSLRERELAIRTALGGNRWHLIRQVLTEALVLAGIGTLLGLGLAWLGIHELSALAPASLPRMDSISINPTVLVFTTLLALSTALIFGIGPALQASKPDIMTVLRASGRNTFVGGGKVLRNCVVIGEIALSFALLVGSGLMLRSFMALQRIDPGFVSQNLLTFQVLGPRRSSPEERAAFTREVRDRLSSMNGVKGVTAASPFPLADPFSPIRWGTEQALGDASKFQAVDFQIVLPGYFETMQTPLLAGRTFATADNDPQRSLVIVDQFLADKAFPHQSAIGKRILIRMRTPEPEWVEIIGVVAHQRNTTLAEAGREQIYFTDGFLGHGAAGRWAIRTQGDPTKYESSVRQTITQLGSQMVLSEIAPMDALMEHAQAMTRLSFVLIAAFASIAALLAALGIYGVLSTVVRQRTPEIGIRMALGAPRKNIFNLVVGQGMTLGAIGVVIGFAVAFGFTRLIASLLVGTKSTDPITFSAITVAFCILVAAASWLPARRAASIEPLEALRNE